MTESNNNFVDYAVTLAGLMDERVKLANNIRKGIDLTMNLTCLLRLKDTFQYIRQQIGWECLLRGHCAESNLKNLQQIDMEILRCNQELNNQINKALMDKILEDFAEFTKRQSNNGDL